MGPLTGTSIIEMGGRGPSPFAAMLLADLGARVLRVERADGRSDSEVPASHDVTLRSRDRIGVDLGTVDGRRLLLDLIADADALIEGFRPGAMERLGLGPEDAAARNERLVYGRMTGYGQTGPLATVAGHDINYVALAGALGACAREDERPLFALNLVGDYGGGGMLLAVGVLAGVLEARRSGRGQVVDVAMVDGVALLTSAIHGLRAAGRWSDRPGTNVLDSGAPFYDVYVTADGGHVAVGALEPRFYRRLLVLVGLDPADWPQHDRSSWPALRGALAAAFVARDREHWRTLLEGEEACATVVLGLADAPAHAHNMERGVFVEVEGVVQPAPAPRFARTPAVATAARTDAAAALARWGVGADRVDRLCAAGVVTGAGAATGPAA